MRLPVAFTYRATMDDHRWTPPQGMERTKSDNDWDVTKMHENNRILQKLLDTVRKQNVEAARRPREPVEQLLARLNLERNERAEVTSKLENPISQTVNHIPSFG